MKKHKFLPTSAEPVHGILLAGGASRRMGQDKARLPWQGTTLLQHLVEQLKKECGQVTVVTRHPNPYPFLTATKDLELAFDQFPGCGALAGLHAGLQYAPADYSFLLACDMPFFSPRVFYQLASHLGTKDAVIVRGQPFHGFYRRSIFPLLEKHLIDGQYRLQTFLQQLDVLEIPFSEIPESELSCFVNLNRPEDYLAAYSTSTSAQLPSLIAGPAWGPY